MRYFPILVGGIGSFNHFVLSDCMLQLGRRRSAWLSCVRKYFGSKNILFEEALSDKFFQALPENFAVDNLVSLAIMVGIIISFSGKCRVVLDQLRASHPLLVLDDTEDLVEGKPQQAEVLFHCLARSGFGERIGNTCFLKAGCPRFWLLAWVRVFAASSSYLRHCCA